MMSVTVHRDKLARVLGLLGSNHDGEVLAAARQAERLRAEAGLTWADIVIPRLPAPSQRRNSSTVVETIAFLLDHEDVLTEWERDFARSIQRARYQLSSKQIEVLQRPV